MVAGGVDTNEARLYKERSRLGGFIAVPRTVRLSDGRDSGVSTSFVSFVPVFVPVFVVCVSGGLPRFGVQAFANRRRIRAGIMHRQHA